MRFESAGQKRKFYRNMQFEASARSLAVVGLNFMRGLGPLVAILALVGVTLAIDSHAGSGKHVFTAAAAPLVVFSRNINVLNQQKIDARKRADTILKKAEDEKRALSAEEDQQVKAELENLTTVNGYIADVTALNNEERQAAGTAARSSAPELAKKPWTSLAEQLKAVHQVAKTSGRDTDPRLLAATGGNEAVDAEGGFLVTPEYADGLFKRTYEVGAIASRAYKQPMSSSRLVLKAVDEDSRVDGSRWGGLQAYWQAEASTYTGTKPKFREMQLVANKLIGLVYGTDELLEDAPAFESYINSAVPEEFAFKIDDALFNGPGNGIPLGVLTSGAPIVVAAEGGQSATTIVTNNILKMWSRMWAPSRKNACWFINQDVEQQLFSLTLGSGTAVVLLYTPPGVNGNNSPYGLLMGRPVIPVEQCATLGTQGDVVLADMSQYILAQRSGIKADASMHVAFLTGEQAFRFTLRCDGQPFWKKPLTPKNGTNTLSPFVTLAAR